MSSATNTSSPRVELPQATGGDQVLPPDHNQASGDTSHLPAGSNGSPANSGNDGKESAGADTAQDTSSAMGGRVTIPAKDASASSASTATTSGAHDHGARADNLDDTAAHDHGARADNLDDTAVSVDCRDFAVTNRGGD
ncbi:hypothetical protein PF005_g27576 [Phytophthora fragariae]|uniref:Uncharacterized protein n=1 Tax=Phytophthora fragariae TaxID=53985 RepID=A0A6A3QQ26_9STRA|nr:hypothetical protein PF003_g8090 [Phytophthora fragariae]KAE8969544.1 hypothetical protein PF011_g26762 [Phytophthora fragariae]KAE9068021.1 hypothetical protein PF010_g27235 [Phytophthora fragariae]KAE9080923.1 hypothetical protein PF006_g27221 [Phytophthora fragariae]KAE9170381.1 hypothetical protein PF005_g27576 [Phytophthora fragariae]